MASEARSLFGGGFRRGWDKLYGVDCWVLTCSRKRVVAAGRGESSLCADGDDPGREEKWMEPEGEEGGAGQSAQADPQAAAGRGGSAVAPVLSLNGACKASS